MAITVDQRAALTGDKVSAASEVLTGYNSSTFAFDASPIEILLFSWQGSVSGQIISLSGVTANWTASILSQRQSTGKTGLAVILLVTNKPQVSLPGPPSVTVTVSTGTIVAWGGEKMLILGASPEVAVAAVGADSAAGTSAAPTATSGSAAVGDIVIAALSLSGPTGDGFTEDTDTTGGTWSTMPVSGTSGGSATTNNTLRSAYKITTATGAQTYNPALGTARNYAEIILGIRPRVAVSASDANGGVTETPVISIIASELKQASTTTALTFPTSASTTVSDDAVPIDFTNPTNILADDGANATITLIAGSGSYILEMIFPAFGLSSRPTGIEIDVESIVGSSLTIEVTVLAGTEAYVDGPVTLAGGVLVFGGSTDNWGFSDANLDAINSAGMTVRIHLFNPAVSSWSASLDYLGAKITYLSVVSNAAESASASAGGTTAKSGTDTNGTIIEITSPFIRETAPDVNGALVEVNSLVALESSANGSGAITEASGVTSPIAASDVNGAITELGTPRAVESSSDANTAVVETATPNAISAAADASAATVDTQIEIAQESSANGSGTITEAGSVSSVTPVSASDTNSATVETTKIGLAGQDTNGVLTEAASEVVIESSADVDGAITEITKLNLVGSDINSVTTESATETTVQLSPDAGSVTAETGVLATAESSADTNAATTEAASLRLAGSDQGSEIEANTLTAQESNADTNTLVSEIATTNTPKTGTDSNSITTEAVTEVAQTSTADAGSDTEIATYKYVLASTADANVVSAETASPKVVESSADANGIVTELGSQSGQTQVSGTDSGSSQETAQPLAALGGTDSSIGAQTAILGAYITSPDGSGSTIETATEIARLVASELGVGFDVANLQITVLSPDAGGAIIEAAKVGLVSADSGYGILEAEAILVSVINQENGNALEAQVLLIHGRVVKPDAPWELLGVKMEDAVLVGARAQGAVLTGAGAQTSTLVGASAQKAKMVGAKKISQLTAILTRVRENG